MLRMLTFMMSKVLKYLLLLLGNLLLTPMRFMVVPPPMASHTISLPSAVCQVAFAPPPQCSDIAVVLSDGRIAVLEDSNASDTKNGFKPPGEPAKLAVTYRYSIQQSCAECCVAKFTLLV